MVGAGRGVGSAVGYVRGVVGRFARGKGRDVSLVGHGDSCGIGVIEKLVVREN